MCNHPAQNLALTLQSQPEEPKDRGFDDGEFWEGLLTKFRPYSFLSFAIAILLVSFAMIIIVVSK